MRFVKCNIHAESNDITSNKNGFAFANTSIICVAFDESFLGKEQNLNNESLTPFKLFSVVWVEKAKLFHTETTLDHRDIKDVHVGGTDRETSMASSRMENSADNA